jgi:hypothetical protein
MNQQILFKDQKTNKAKRQEKQPKQAKQEYNPALPQQH